MCQTCSRRMTLLATRGEGHDADEGKVPGVGDVLSNYSLHLARLSALCPIDRVLTPACCILVGGWMH